jgi:TPR repeat protein
VKLDFSDDWIVGKDGRARNDRKITRPNTINCYFLFSSERDHVGNVTKPSAISALKKSSNSIVVQHPDVQSMFEKPQTVEQATLLQEWKRLLQSGYELSGDEFARILKPGEGRELQLQSKNGDPVASVALLRFVGFCLTLPTISEPLGQDSGDGKKMLTDQDCYSFFGDGIRDRQALNSLSLNLLRTIAQSGFDPAATEYWRSLVALDASARAAIENGATSMAEHTANALSLLTTLANKGDTGAVLALVEAYQYGRMVEANPQLAAHYAAVLVRQPEYAAIPWLKKLATTEKK